MNLTFPYSTLDGYIANSYFLELWNIQKLSCRMKVHSLARTLLLGMATPKGSPLTDPLKIALLKLRDDEILRDLELKWNGEECAKEVCGDINLDLGARKTS